MTRVFASSAALALAAVAMPASAAVFVVDAQANSSSGGTAFATGILLNSGDPLTVSSDLNDLWSAGALPRFSDANGLVGVRFATALDDSGQPVGTQIGADFGLWTQNGFTAPYGSLVGRIGTSYQLLGANFSGPAWGTGNLELFYWDSNNFDNSGRITFAVNQAGAVPEPSTWAMMLLGFAAVGAMLRSTGRRRKRALDFA